MALAIQSTTSNFNIFTSKKKKHSSSSSVHHLPIFFPIKTRFITVIRSTTQSSSSSSSSSSSTSSEDSKPTNGEGIQEENKPNKTGVGFGSSTSSSSVETIDNNNKKKKKKGARSRERASITRRTPVEKPAFLSQKRAGGGGGGGGTPPQVEKQSETEKAFLLTWLGLGCVILIQGLTLSASGFLPEEWDKFLVKYLYPTFTPTVFFFVCGTVVYGVLKYMQGEEGKS